MADLTKSDGIQLAFEQLIGRRATPAEVLEAMRFEAIAKATKLDFLALTYIAGAIERDQRDKIVGSIDEMLVQRIEEIERAIPTGVEAESIVQRVTACVMDEVSRGVKETIVPRLFGKQLDYRLRWGAAGAAIAGLLTVGSLAVGIFAGMGIASNHYEMQYEARVAAIPHLSNEVNTVVGRLTLDLIRKNSETALRNIVECRADAGLILELSKSGERVCVGEKHAKAGWRLP